MGIIPSSPGYGAVSWDHTWSEITWYLAYTKNSINLDYFNLVNHPYFKVLLKIHNSGKDSRLCQSIFYFEWTKWSPWAGLCSLYCLAARHFHHYLIMFPTYSLEGGITSVPRKFSSPWRRKKNLDANIINGNRRKMKKTTHNHLQVRKMRFREAKWKFAQGHTAYKAQSRDLRSGPSRCQTSCSFHFT